MNTREEIAKVITELEKVSQILHKVLDKKEAEFLEHNEEYIGSISIKWTVYDVLQRAGELNIPLSEKEAQIILKNISKLHDATIGVNWDVIDAAILDYVNWDKS